jgi:hypothetical protein
MLISDVATRMDTAVSLGEGIIMGSGMGGTTDTMLAGVRTGMVHEAAMDITAVLVA